MAKTTEILASIIIAISLAIHGAMARGPYMLRHIAGYSKLCLEVVGGNPVNHMLVQLSPCVDKKSQLWKIVKDDWTILVLGKCLVAGGDLSAGGYLMIDDCERSSAAAKSWRLWPNGTLTHLHSGLVLTAMSGPDGTSPRLGMNEYTTNQHWKSTDYVRQAVDHLIACQEGCKGAEKGKRDVCLEAQEDNSHVWVSECDDGNRRQDWIISWDGSLRTKYDESLCLTCEAPRAGYAVYLAKCEGRLTQRWVVDIDDEVIINPYSDLVVDIKGGDVGLNEIVMAARNGKPSQQWICF